MAQGLRLRAVLHAVVGGCVLLQAVLLFVSFGLLALGGVGGPYRDVAASGIIGPLMNPGSGTPLVAILGLPTLILALPMLGIGLRLLAGQPAGRGAVFASGSFLVLTLVSVLLGAVLSVVQVVVLAASVVVFFIMYFYREPNGSLPAPNKADNIGSEGEGQTRSESRLPDEAAFAQRLRRRHTWSRAWQGGFLLSTLVGLVALVALFVNVLDGVFGTVAIANEIAPETLSDRPLEELSGPELAAMLGDHAARRLRVIVRDELSVVDPAQFTQLPVRESLAGASIRPEVADLTINEMSDAQVMALLSDNLSRDALYGHVIRDVVGLEIFHTWPLSQTWFDYASIEAEFAALVQEQDVPNARLEFRSWLSWDFISSPQSSFPEIAGVRTAIIGTLWIMIITMVVAFPLGVGAAIYLEEYARGGHWLEKIIETNIRNLAGVPSIIYGLLGLAIFVRAFEQITSGAFVGVTESNGRTILSASLTLALLILPVIIIAAQEAIRAVPSSIREASFGLGATQWQTIWRQVLPAAMPGVLTGTILSLSRAIGETAPLIVVGASAVIFVDPAGPFAKFTALPIQIWQWTARPQDEFRNIAAAAILVLLGLLLVLNSAAILLRQRFSRRLGL